MVQIERAGSKLDKADIKEILSQTGFNLDPEYGPFLVNPMLGRYVVRGTATPESEFKLRRMKGVKLFKDIEIQSLDR